ncbi:dihydrofolate reductase family protein [Mesorhizobium sp. CAU 1741]|uniref:dihydrofolate reductase family protein n=1 Tax=Mesorhizobium sp. CAU 1741 TaxID=3140366 RepID=UPI00325AA0F1
MSSQHVVYMFAMSLDGFIARPDGTFDWLDDFPADADYDFDAFLASLSGIVMGRASYEAARRGGGWDYGKWPCAIATRRPVDDLPNNTTAMDGEPRALLDDLKRRGADGRIWLFGGGQMASQFLKAGLLDTIELATIPVILGQGIPAFGFADGDSWLDLDFARQLSNGAVHSRYRVRTTTSAPG